MRKFAVCAVALAVTAMPAAALSTPAPTTAFKAGDEKTSDTSDARKIVCKREETIGSRLGAKKVCLTVQEWEDFAKHHRDTTEDWQRKADYRKSN